MKTAMRLMLVAIVLGFALLQKPANSFAQSNKPNIVFIIADDLDSESMNHLPRLQSLLADRGTTFANFFVSLALCCPSRASILRGQYAHNTEIFTNDAPGGGFRSSVISAARNQPLLPGSVMQVPDRPHGQVPNGYPLTTYVPPGWDEWYGVVGGVNFFNYSLNENGNVVRYGSEPEAY